MVSIGQGEHNPIYSELLQSFKLNQLVLTLSDETKLLEYQKNFKIQKIKYSVVSFMLTYLQSEVEGSWKYAFSQYQWLLESFPPSIDTNQVDGLLQDIVSVFVLRMSTQAFIEVQANKNFKAALDAMIAVRFGCTQFKQPKEIVY